MPLVFAKTVITVSFFQLKPSYLGHFYLNSQPVIWNVCGEQNFFIRQFFYSNKIKFTQVQKSVKKQLSTFVWANTLILELNAGSHLISPSQTLTLEGALHSITTFFQIPVSFFQHLWDLLFFARIENHSSSWNLRYLVISY